MSWILIVIFLSGHGNYVVTSTQYKFASKTACQHVRKQLATALIADSTILTDCVEDEE